MSWNDVEPAHHTDINKEFAQWSERLLALLKSSASFGDHGNRNGRDEKAGRCLSEQCCQQNGAEENPDSSSGIEEDEEEDDDDDDDEDDEEEEEDLESVNGEENLLDVEDLGEMLQKVLFGHQPVSPLLSSFCIVCFINNPFFLSYQYVFFFLSHSCFSQ